MASALFLVPSGAAGGGGFEVPDTIGSIDTFDEIAISYNAAGNVAEVCWTEIDYGSYQEEFSQCAQNPPLGRLAAKTARTTSVSSSGTNSTTLSFTGTWTEATVFAGPLPYDYNSQVYVLVLREDAFTGELNVGPVRCVSLLGESGDARGVQLSDPGEPFDDKSDYLLFSNCESVIDLMFYS